MDPRPSLDFDIGDFEDIHSADVAIKDPTTGKPTAAVVTLAGPEHPARKKILFARQRKLRKNLQRSGKLELTDPEEDEADEIDYLVDCTLGWRGLVKGGQALAFSKDAARALYEDPKRRWLRDQVRAALDEREAFIARSATIS